MTRFTIALFATLLVSVNDVACSETNLDQLVCTDIGESCTSDSPCCQGATCIRCGSLSVGVCFAKDGGR